MCIVSQHYPTARVLLLRCCLRQTIGKCHSRSYLWVSHRQILVHELSATFCQWDLLSQDGAQSAAHMSNQNLQHHTTSRCHASSARDNYTQHLNTSQSLVILVVRMLLKCCLMRAIENCHTATPCEAVEGRDLSRNAHTIDE